MSDYPEVVTDNPPLPPLLEVAWVLSELKWGELRPGLDRDRLAAAFGGVLPHRRVVLRWRRILVRTPMKDFPGGPLWYQFLGDAPCRVDAGALDEQGTPIGRRLVQPGEVVGAHTYHWEMSSAWRRVDDPRQKKKKAKHGKHRAPSAVGAVR